MKGPPAARAASAAVWGAVALTRPENARKNRSRRCSPTPSTEVRIEAARAFGNLKRARHRTDRKSPLEDPSPEVERAAPGVGAGAGSRLSGPSSPTCWGARSRTVRPAVRKNLIEALARLGESQINRRHAGAGARAIKDSDAATRVAAAEGFLRAGKKGRDDERRIERGRRRAVICGTAAKDERDEVKTAAAACLPDVAARTIRRERPASRPSWPSRDRYRCERRRPQALAGASAPTADGAPSCRHCSS